MTKRELYDQYDRSQPHRIPRCKTCHLIMPCRADGAWGACDARDVSHDSHARTCDLLRAIFSVPLSRADRAESAVAGKMSSRVRAARLATARAERANTETSWPRKSHCTNGHEMTPDNTGEFLRNGRLRIVCRACKAAEYQRFRAKQKDQVAA